MAKAKDAFRTISEVAEWLDTPTHVLRFWETKFSQIRPVKGAGGRRYYRPSDMDLLGGIKQLLHEDGLTIKGTQKLLREKGAKYVATLGPSVVLEEPDTAAPPPLPAVSPPPQPAPAPKRSVALEGLPDVPGRLIGRAPVKASALRGHLPMLAPLVARLESVSDRLPES